MKIVHCSDLHFGRDEANLLPAFKASLAGIAPDLVVVSGDFTQHGWHAEFEKARNFLRGLPCPFFAVPGNHDIPGYHHLVERFTQPYARYRRYINEDICPVLEMPKTVFGGINSARRLLPHWNWANGAVSESQLQQLEDVFSRANGRWKICVLHHPVHAVENAPIDVRVFGAKRTLRAFARLGVDLVMTGHMHRASARILQQQGQHTVYLNASTALSTRLRDDENGFNLVSLEENRLTIEFWKYRSGAFTGVESLTHQRAR
ncbi:MAG TPA: metallophosphoesterase [Alphaproteobacteria bacterium]|nr:metallophosphoesterase [Alphaproteobacteria bacterium]